MVVVQIEDLLSQRKFDLVRDRFDAVIYGHPLSAEDRVQELDASGVEVWRYFNVFHVNLHAPEWSGYFADLYARMGAIQGFIPGARYRWFPSDLGPSPIIDHRRYEVTQTLHATILDWASQIQARRVILDVTFDSVHDWMLWPGDSWPWPPEQHAAVNAGWGENMKALVALQGAERPIAINGSYKIEAPVVMFENQVWNDARGQYTWPELFQRVTTGDVVPILNVGHKHLDPVARARGELMTLAAWLLFDRAYLSIEMEPEELDWVERIVESGVDRFQPVHPLLNVFGSIWLRRGEVDGVIVDVRLDAVRGDALIVGLPPAAALILGLGSP